MAFFETFLTAYILAILFFSFIRPQIAVGMYLPYLILVPFLNVETNGISFQYNMVNIILLLGFFLNHRKKYIYWKPFLPFLFFYLAQLAVFPFQELSASIMFNTWRIDTMKFLILPFVMYNFIMDDAKLFKIYKNILLISIIIACAYGLYLTKTPGTNPYMMYMFAKNGAEFNEAYALGFSGGTDIIDYKIDTGRMFGRISSVFRHPMTFGLFLCMSFIYLLGTYKKNKMILTALPILFVGLNTITCGVRSSLGALALTMTFLLIRLKNVKLFFTSIVLLLIVYVSLANFMPNLNEYLFSMIDTESSEVGGSSISLRLDQLQGCLVEIKNNFVFGKGYGWTQYYMNINETHPIILAFESLVFVVLCNEGLVFGLSLWLFFSAMIIRLTHNIKKRSHRIFLQSMFLAYVSYAIITGDYGYMQYFILFFIMLYAEYKSLETESMRKRKVSAVSSKKKKSNLKNVLSLHF